MLDLCTFAAASASGAIEDLTPTGLADASAGLSECCARMESARDLGAKRYSDVPRRLKDYCVGELCIELRYEDALAGNGWIRISATYIAIKPELPSKQSAGQS